MRKTKTGISASRKTYMGELIAERLSGYQAPSTFTTASMQWGKDNEPAALETYGFATGHAITRVGFVDHGTIAWAGVSPDGLAGDDGLVSIKCPNTATHIDTLMGAPIDPDYLKQMHWEMACTGRQWCDFVSFDPRMPPEMQLHIRRVNRSPVEIAEMEQAVRVFLGEIETAIAELQRLFQQAAA